MKRKLLALCTALSLAVASLAAVAPVASADTGNCEGDPHNYHAGAQFNPGNVDSVQGTFKLGDWTKCVGSGGDDDDGAYAFIAMVGDNAVGLGAIVQVGVRRCDMHFAGEGTNCDGFEDQKRFRAYACDTGLGPFKDCEGWDMGSADALGYADKATFRIDKTASSFKLYVDKTNNGSFDTSVTIPFTAGEVDDWYFENMQSQVDVERFDKGYEAGTSANTARWGGFTVSKLNDSNWYQPSWNVGSNCQMLSTPPGDPIEYCKYVDPNAFVTYGLP